MRFMSYAFTVAMGGLALASACSVNAQDWEWSPQKTTTLLRGTLTFLPNNNEGAPFRCKVSLTFKTGNFKHGADALPQIISGKIRGKGCESVTFLDLPWYIGAYGDQLAGISQFGWGSGKEFCRNDGVYFNVRTDGTWDFAAGTCFNGVLTSDPPVTIVALP